MPDKFRFQLARRVSEVEAHRAPASPMRYQPFVRLALQTDDGGGGGGGAGGSVTAYSQPMEAGDSNALTVEWVVSALLGNDAPGEAPIGTSLTIAMQQSDDSMNWSPHTSFSDIQIDSPGAGVQGPTPTNQAVKWLRMKVTLQNGEQDPPTEDRAVAVLAANLVTSSQ